MKYTNSKKNKDGGGFIKITLIIVAALVILKYAYDIDVVGFLTQGTPKTFLDWLYRFGDNSWERYRDIIAEVWNYILGLIKKIFDNK